MNQQKGKKEVFIMEETKKVYTCPMHPKVVSDKPGACPQCGMFLIKKEEKNE